MTNSDSQSYFWALQTEIKQRKIKDVWKIYKDKGLNKLREEFPQQKTSQPLESIVSKVELEEMLQRELPEFFPLALSYRGSLDHLRKPKVAIVGSRHPTYYGRKLAYEFSHVLASAGVSIISGGAIGIDAIANHTALQVGSSCAILGSGLSRMYPPRNLNLFLSMQKQGLLLSEFEEQSSPQKWNFPRRNYTIAALADFVLVIEATLTSGSLITAQHALSCNVDVGALPGPVDNLNCVGTNYLIKEGAYCIQTPEDVLSHILNFKPYTHNRKDHIF